MIMGPMPMPIHVSNAAMRIKYHRENMNFIFIGAMTIFGGNLHERTTTSKSSNIVFNLVWNNFSSWIGYGFCDTFSLGSIPHHTYMEPLRVWIGMGGGRGRNLIYRFDFITSLFTMDGWQKSQEIQNSAKNEPCQQENCSFCSLFCFPTCAIRTCTWPISVHTTWLEFDHWKKCPQLPHYIDSVFCERRKGGNALHFISGKVFFALNQANF